MAFKRLMRPDQLEDLQDLNPSPTMFTFDSADEKLPLFSSPEKLQLLPFDKLTFLNIGRTGLNGDTRAELLNCLWSSTVLEELQIDCKEINVSFHHLVHRSAVSNCLRRLELWFGILEKRETALLGKALETNRVLSILNINYVTFKQGATLMKVLKNLFHIKNVGFQVEISTKELFFLSKCLSAEVEKDKKRKIQEQTCLEVVNIRQPSLKQPQEHLFSFKAGTHFLSTIEKVNSLTKLSFNAGTIFRNKLFVYTRFFREIMTKYATVESTNIHI